MPKNNKKKKKPRPIEERPLPIKEDGQEYALISKMLGNCRCECKCHDGRTRLGHIRGKMIKRVWICVGDTVLLSLRDYQDEKADIIHKYTHEEAKTLGTYGEINTNLKVEENTNDEESDLDCEIDFEDI